MDAEYSCASVKSVQCLGAVSRWSTLAEPTKRVLRESIWFSYKRFSFSIIGTVGMLGVSEFTLIAKTHRALRRPERQPLLIFSPTFFDIYRLIPKASVTICVLLASSPSCPRPYFQVLH